MRHSGAQEASLTRDIDEQTVERPAELERRIDPD